MLGRSPILGSLPLLRKACGKESIIMKIDHAAAATTGYAQNTTIINSRHNTHNAIHRAAGDACQKAVRNAVDFADNFNGDTSGYHHNVNATHEAVKKAAL
jgi:hypothetical protein